MAQGIVITADDVVRTGACASGVYDFLRRRKGKRLPAAMSATAVLRIVDEDKRGYVTAAADLDGHGSGHGDGSGYGGYGYGYEYGDGYGQ